MHREEGDDIFITQSSVVNIESNVDSDGDFQFRFGDPMDINDIDKELQICVPKTTKYKNDLAVSVFSRWQEERRQRSMNCNLDLPKMCLTESIFEMSSENLNLALKFFLFEARKQDGGLYPSHTMYGLYAAFQSAMRAKGSEINIFEDKEFEESRRCLDAVMRKRSAEGLGAGSRKPTETISVIDEEKLWQSGVLGDETPRKLLDTVPYLTGLHFALKGGKEHRSLRMFVKPQITGPHKDDNGRTYLLYTEDVSKTNCGGLKQRKQAPKKVSAYENTGNKDRCYIRIFQKYRSLCEDNKSTDYFYFTPWDKPKDGSWFLRTAVGHNTLQATVKRLCREAGVQGTKTNHSLRATDATRLYQANVDEQMICEMTGHKSEAVRCYKRTSDVQKSTLSDMLTSAPLKRLKSEATTSTTAVATHETTDSETLDQLNQRQSRQ